MNIAIKSENMNIRQALAGKVSLITGSTSGIGLGIARALAAAGSEVVLNGFGKPEEVAAVQAKIASDFQVRVSLGLRAAAVTDRFASLARLLSPVLDVLIRLWLAEGFLVADVMQHMLGDQTTVRDHLPPSALLFASLAATGFGIFVQTICPVLLAAGLFTRLAALALLLQVLVLQMPGHAQLAPYSVALLGWIVVLGPGPLSLDGMFRPGIGAAALPLVGLVSRGLAGLTRHIGPFYAFLLRLWIAAGLAAIALGGVKGLTALILIVLIPTGMLSWGDHFGWITLLNLPLLGL